MNRKLLHAFKLRCPNCGEGKLNKTWLKVNPACASCRLKFDRGEHDYFIGAYTLNLIGAELIVVAAILAGLIGTWPHVPWDALMWSLLPLAIIAPLATLPFARAVWLALDLQFRPAEPADFEPTD